MDFQISRLGNKVLVRLKAEASNSEAVDSFCSEYKQHLTDAAHSNIKLNVLFDLRHATFSMLQASSGRLKAFFGKEIHDLSEKTIAMCTVVINSAPLAATMQILLNSFPGTVPTYITDVYPSKSKIK